MLAAHITWNEKQRESTAYTERKNLIKANTTILYLLDIKAIF